MQVSVSLKYCVEKQKQKQMDVSGCISGTNIKFTKIKEKIEIGLIGVIKVFLINGTHYLHCKVNRQGRIFQRRQMSLKGEREKKKR